MKNISNAKKTALSTSGRPKKVVQGYVAYPVTDLANENLAAELGAEEFTELLLPGHRVKKKVWKLKDYEHAKRLFGTVNEYKVFTRFVDGSISRFHPKEEKERNKTRKAKRALEKTRPEA